MATWKMPLKDDFSETAASGDTLVLMAPVRRQSSYPYNTISIAVFPVAGSTTVETTLSPTEKVIKDPDDPSINWIAWANGVITPASTGKDDQLSANVTAIRIKPTGGDCVVEARF